MPKAKKAPLPCACCNEPIPTEKIPPRVDHDLNGRVCHECFICLSIAEMNLTHHGIAKPTTNNTPTR